MERNGATIVCECGEASNGWPRAQKRYHGAGRMSTAVELEELLVWQNFGLNTTSTMREPKPALVQDVTLLGVLHLRAGNKNRALDLYNTVHGWISADMRNATFAANTVNNHATIVLT
jgi:hypothetical protein